MKRYIIGSVLILILFINQPILTEEPAQTSPGSLNPGIMNYGIRLGINFSSMTGSNLGNMSAKPGFAFGFFLEYPLMNNLSIQPEILYSVKGAKESYTYQDYDHQTFSLVNVTDTYTMSISYIEIPVPIKLHFSMPGSQITPHVYAGPSFNIKAGASVKVDYDGQTYESDLDDVKSFDIGVQIGGGVRLNHPFGLNSLVKGLKLTIHYERGLGNIKDTDYDWDAKNTNVSLRAGFEL